MSPGTDLQRGNLSFSASYGLAELANGLGLKTNRDFLGKTRIIRDVTNSMKWKSGVNVIGEGCHGEGFATALAVTPHRQIPSLFMTNAGFPQPRLLPLVTQSMLPDEELLASGVIAQMPERTRSRLGQGQA